MATDITVQLEALLRETTLTDCRHEKATYWLMDSGRIIIEYPWGELEAIERDGSLTLDTPVINL
jgi:hypothetical protein